MRALLGDPAGPVQRRIELSLGFHLTPNRLKLSSRFGPNSLPHAARS